MLAREQIAQLVDELMRQLAEKGALKLDMPAAAAPSPAVALNPAGVYETVDAAVQAAQGAWGEFRRLSLHKRREIIEAMRAAALAAATPLAEMAVQETGMGRLEHKVMKNQATAEKTPGVEDITTTAWSGDGGLTLVERQPWGVVGCITPTTNPTSTVINNAISLVAAGNAVVFNPHPNADRCSIKALEILNEAIRSAGGPPSLLTSVADPNIETAQAVFAHKDVDALLVTGGAAVVRAALATGKKVWAAGPGNPPTVVDETADLEKAAKDIVDGASFDNCVLCTGEKEAFVVGSVCDTLKANMVRHGAFEVKWSEVSRLERLLFQEGATGQRRPMNTRWVGKDAALILKEAGIQAPPGVRLVICEVPKDHPFVWTEMLCPVLAIVRCADADEAIDLAVQAEGGRQHTASIHSTHIARITRFARESAVNIFVNNGPTIAGLGIGGEGFCTMSISGSTGEGCTSARTFTKERRAAIIGNLRLV